MKYRYRRYVLYYLTRVCAFLIYLFPLKCSRPIGGLLGRISYYILPHYRNLTLANLRAALGRKKTRREIKGIGVKVFENIGKNGVELLNFPKINRGNIDRAVSVIGLEKLDRALESGRGAILVTGHIGNWELLALAIKLKGYKGAVIARRIYFDRYDKFLNALRGFHALDVIYRDDSPKKILRVLKDNGIIGILADQDVDSVDGVFVDFFGMPAYTPSSPVAMASASGARILPCCIIREGDAHKLFIDDPLELDDTGDRQSDLVSNTKKWSNRIESYIQRNPDQWVWMHKRWKTKVV